MLGIINKPLLRTYHYQAEAFCVTTYNKPETLMYCVTLHGLGTVVIHYGHLYSAQLMSAQSSLCISANYYLNSGRELLGGLSGEEVGGVVRLLGYYPP